MVLAEVSRRITIADTLANHYFLPISERGEEVRIPQNPQLSCSLLFEYRIAFATAATTTLRLPDHDIFAKEFVFTRRSYTTLNTC